jgi:inner membrane protein
MDNISHSLVGLAVGELVQRTLPPEPQPQAQSLRRRLLLIACCAASNLPDLDLVMSRLLPAPLGNLLHHRGYSHTFLFALVQAVLLVAVLWTLWPAARALLRTSSAARTGLLAVTVVGFLMHIALDYLNSYGVHPLYPFNQRWLYGDILFIVEPVLWIAFGVPLALMLQTRWLKTILLALLAAVVALATARGFLHWVSMLALAILGLAMAWLAWRAPARSKRVLLAAFGVALAFIGAQAAASGAGKRLIARELHAIDPGSRLLDTSMTGYPANPLCWVFVSIERNDGAGTYRLRRGLVSVVPSLVPVASCPAAFAEPVPSRSLSVRLAWQGEGRLADLRSRAADCHFHAWLRFARAPAVGPVSATDARFSMGAGDNFSTFSYAPFVNLPCPASVPPWDLPRQDLLAP